MKKSPSKIQATLEFSEIGYLRAVYPCCQDMDDQLVLERALRRILDPRHVSWIARLFR